MAEKPVTAGELRHPVLIQRPATGEGIPYGETLWQDVATRRAYVRPASVREIFVAQGFIGQQDRVFVIRYEPLFHDLDHRWRLLFRGNVHAVTGVTNRYDRWLKVQTRRTDAGQETPVAELAAGVLPELLG
ncbi:hypothetical protein CI610_00350 [invertebrate metagenome]|uniref:Uncharacterized protein n=1 Tax=invertebrate metagenome TaxID=1711999 RepID=A0A2H9TBX4_9ZZZZ